MNVNKLNSYIYKLKIDSDNSKLIEEIEDLKRQLEYAKNCKNYYRRLYWNERIFNIGYIHKNNKSAVWKN